MPVMLSEVERSPLTSIKRRSLLYQVRISIAFSAARFSRSSSTGDGA